MDDVVMPWAFGGTRMALDHSLTHSLTHSILINYWAACAPSHKMGFRSSAAKNGLPGERRHEGLVRRNDVLTNGFISVSLARSLARILFVPRLRSPLKNPQSVANLKKAICVVRSDSIMGVTL